jgi:hypothetical protein
MKFHPKNWQNESNLHFKNNSFEKLPNFFVKKWQKFTPKETLVGSGTSATNTHDVPSFHIHGSSCYKVSMI